MARNSFIAGSKLVILLVAIGNVVAQRGTESFLAATSDDCDGDISFELITGYVYSSADDIMDSKIGTLQLTECIEFCKSKPQCQALNFETGLCVLFDSQAGDNSDLLAVSQFPVFTLYGQKICLSSSRPPCTSPWVYETTPGLAISKGFIADNKPASSRQECAFMCIMEEKFICRAANWDASSNTCKLSQVDRNMAGRKQFIEKNDAIDYIELACVAKPERLCEFQRLSGKILKTVDAVYQDIQSTDECKDLCLNADFSCYSYDYKSAGDEICRLSHHSSATLAHIQEPYLEIDNATTFELQSCYQVSVECRGSEMLARITTSTLFEGKVYARARPNSCVVDVKNTTEFEITLPYNDVDCDVVQEGPGTFSSNIVIQHHDMIVTAADIGLALHCKYELENQTVTNSLLTNLEVKGDLTNRYNQTIIEETTVVDSPNVTMLVTDPLGLDIISAQVGDNLALRFEILELGSPYEIFVRELVAMDGQDNSEILLIDGNGCPTDPTIMQAVIQVQGGKVLHAPFQAFKFPASDIVQFRALVTPCLPRCEPVNCNVLGFDGARRSTNSYGRKKREVHEKDIRVAQSVRITDKFQFSAIEREDIEAEIIEYTCSSSFTSVVIACSMFLLAQLVMLMAWSYLWHKKRATKQIEPVYQSQSEPPSLYFNSCNTSVASLHNYFSHS